MNSMPIPGTNISQMIFEQNQKLIMPSDSVSDAYQNLSALSGLNSMPQETNDMHRQMPAFLAQAHLSTYYQDNPWNILTASTKYGSPVLGGNLIPDQPPGYKPGNVLRKSYTPPVPSVSSAFSGGGKEHFENDNIKWQ